MVTTKQTDQPDILSALEQEFTADKIAPLRRAAEDYSGPALPQHLIREALGRVDETETYWTDVAARILLAQLYREQKERRGTEEVYGDFAHHVRTQAEAGFYTTALTEQYSERELREIG